MKYKLTRNTKMYWNIKLYQIKALKDFGDVKKWDLGWWIEKESNLSQYGNSWVSDNACVTDNALVFGNSRVTDSALVAGDACVSGNAFVNGWIKLYAWRCFAGNRKIGIYQK